MVIETKEMLDAACNESVSQASIYRWYYEFKSGRKSEELIGEPGTPTAVLTKQTVNPAATMILDDSHLTVRQLFFCWTF